MSSESAASRRLEGPGRCACGTVVPTGIYHYCKPVDPLPTPEPVKCPDCGVWWRTMTHKCFNPTKGLTNDPK